MKRFLIEFVAGALYLTATLALALVVLGVVCPDLQIIKEIGAAIRRVHV